MEMESVSEAEALVAKFPNSSKAWVDGALSYLHYGGINKARVFTEGHQNDKFKRTSRKIKSVESFDDYGSGIQEQRRLACYIRRSTET
ncbi:hypothetical protein AVEN_199166-1 [Araneus ventricosus]|uniref:Uncharacterized protein n=1 Tax=Araneus ventricosus TaxID=182803 RepID=A0A4Y2SLF4_ARAVE|nr:hypothetical protein AVEN_72204-1 [Araneus ventricosus]GBN88059.1 hypothetical protein AVEN_199166-1 [Araneus ventricosus]